jgi:hypothetical protein
MDIHAPHEPVHSWRDFFTHLIIVTIGLFIALSLEAFVEHIHHIHLVREARENIRTEIEGDHTAAEEDLKLVQQAIDRAQSNIDAIHRLQAHPKDFHGSLNSTLDFNSPDVAAFRTARDTGALSYMPYSEVQRYSDLYFLADVINTKALSTGDAVFQSLTAVKMYSIDDLPPEEVTDMLRGNANALLQLIVLKQMIQQFDTACLEELKHQPS